MAFIFNKTLRQGDSWLIQFTFDDGASAQLDISADDFWYTAKPDFDDDDTDAINSLITVDPGDWTKDDSGAFGGGIVDRISYLVPATDTHTIPVDDHVQDLQQRRGGRLFTTGAGQLVIEGQVTRRTT